MMQCGYKERVMNSNENPSSPTAPAGWFGALKKLATPLASAQFLGSQADVVRFYGEVGAALARQFGDAWMQLAQHPERVLQHQIDWLDHQLDLARNMAFAPLGIASADCAGTPARDKRFADEEWRKNPLFSWIRQSYVINAEFLQQLIASVDEPDPVKRRQLEYFTRQFISAMSPSNFVLTNPELLRDTVAQQGRNLVGGARKLLQHFDADWDGINLHMADPTNFRLGETLAATPGAAVFQNELMQLIQYAPATPDVCKRPLLLLPPWVNKYYIMDLSPENSLVRWLVSQGHTVFIISWINPDERHRDVRFDDYLRLGPLTALDVICDICETDEVNAIGYCLGGTLLGITAAYLKARGDRRLRSMTCFNSLFDYSQPGDLSAYLTDPVLAALERFVRSKGYHDGRLMAFSFNTLAENSLFWPTFIDSYVRNRQPPAFDLLYWNMDNTNLPAEMYIFYLREVYQHNRLATPGALRMCDVPIDMTSIDIPCYFVAAATDHITPWQSTFRNTQIVQGPARFVLSGSGHIAGIINPPAANKYGYHYSDHDVPHADAQQWRERAQYHDGSWWPDWQRWITALDDSKVAARAVGNARHPALEPAPGSYVRKRLLQED
jgi:polyhydroxyalkanoate synthase